MRFREITLDQLVPFVESDEFQTGRIIPITPSRARSQAANPAGRPDDIVLTIAYDEDNEIIGYIGALPDHPVSGKVKRMAWNSCWWVDPDMGSEAAIQLFLKFLDQWDKNVLFSEMTPHTYQIVDRMEFFQTKVCRGFRGYMRFSLADILSQRHIFFLRIRGLIAVIDGCFNLFRNLRLKIWLGLNKAAHDHSWEYIDPADNRVQDLITGYRSHFIGTRGQEDFTWIKNNPWVLEGRDDELAKRYYFTSCANTFRQPWVLINIKNEPAVFMVLNNRDGHLKIPYLFTGDNGMAAVRDFLIPYMIREGIKDVTTFHNKLAGLLFVSKIPLIHRKSVLRFTGISKTLLEQPGGDFNFQDGDGDGVFT